MPTRAVSVETMEVGKKGGGKHWTKEEIDARQEAAEALKRKKKQELKPPSWLGSEALKIWKQKIKDVGEVDLLDVLDAETIALYCDAVVKYKALSQRRILSNEDHKTLQAYSRIIAALSDKLGFNPAARARLIKKRAERRPADRFGDKFD